ncbi:hypothetical protein ACH5RR_002518 [Cinchona calisaya]|uniref:Amino acid transporter transmembrane domain-containing protein n=1 Tax=Cinchona calisaya TaxID=153742 RepID=A0ABD3B6E7_9GENT
MVFIALLWVHSELWVTLLSKENTKDIITANLGKGLFSTLVQLGLCINLFFIFPLMMNPAFEVFLRRFWDGCYCLWMRWLLVLGVSLVALFVPNFADFLSLVRSSTCCALGFVLPALYHYLVFKEEMDWKGHHSDLAIIYFSWGFRKLVFTPRDFLRKGAGLLGPKDVNGLCVGPVARDVDNNGARLLDLFAFSFLFCLRVRNGARDGANNRSGTGIEEKGGGGTLGREIREKIKEGEEAVGVAVAEMGGGWWIWGWE